MSDFKTKKPLYKPVKSTRKGKKGMVYVMKEGKKRLIHFGDSSMSDMTQHKDPLRKERYIKTKLNKKRGHLAPFHAPLKNASFL